jgi:hypothetical protein
LTPFSSGFTRQKRLLRLRAWARAQSPVFERFFNVHVRYQRNALPGQRGGYRHLMQIVAHPLRRIIQRNPALFSIARQASGFCRR